MIRRNAVCITAGAALALSLAACGGGDGGKKAQGGSSTSGKTQLAAEQISTASQKAGTIKSFKATVSTDTTTSGQNVKMTGRISYRLSPKLAMRMTVPGMSVNGKETGGFEEVLLGDYVYMKMPALSQQTGGKPWIKMSLSKIGAKSGIDIKSLMNQSKQADPSANTRMLTASKDVTKVGTETVGGTQTTHYKGTYSVQEALAKLSGDQRAAMQQMVAKSGLDKMNFDLWLDDQQLPRKMTVRTPAGSQVQSTTTTTYTGFNQPVSISAPPAGQVTSAG
ncbi:LolA-like protein [Actinoallomurus rhizosphaericola]|uniref:hypothetical protein n=1 Tax=Actinoallomurus rhizosphaericola TaxID=2952536 RepID=UPI002091ACA2|nr:hypothetical protein [Actinoallomurus rhizosphaericola]MCO5994654.1 hypothetical protein [Actinoallomurus rhizosphaericola]